MLAIQAAHGTGSGYLRFKAYHSSPLELAFLNNTPPSRSSRYCDLVREHAEDIDAWLDWCETARRSTANPAGFPREVFSFFEYEDASSQGAGPLLFPIEPLSFLLRHPYALCRDEQAASKSTVKRTTKALFDGSYMLFASAAFTSYFEDPSIFIDLGAEIKSTQGVPLYHLKTYEKQGVQFDRIFMWEAAPLHMPSQLAQFPPSWFHALSFFNEPVQSKAGPKHPYGILDKVARKRSFVSIKIDIDTPLLELELMNDILNRSSRDPYVHELFIEQHFKHRMMARYWKKKVLGDYHDAISRLLQLRNRGIRAHAWY